MKPSEYYSSLVEPTIAEYESDPTNIRRAYAACLFTYHFADAAAVHLGSKVSDVTDDLAKLAPEFILVRAIANMSKHVVLEPSLNKGRPIPRIEDTNIGLSAPYEGGIYYDGGVGYEGADPVVRIKDDKDRFHDVRWCVREARRAVEAYLQRPDMQ